MTDGGAGDGGSAATSDAAALTLVDYQRLAATTMNRALEPSDVLLDAAAGLSEEAGEVLAHVRKHLFQGRDLGRDAVAEELGDALWCVAAVATALGFSLEDVARRNAAKIARRHADRAATAAPTAAGEGPPAA